MNCHAVVVASGAHGVELIELLQRSMMEHEELV